MITRTAMNDGVLTLATWLSPACPIGSFTYSHGLEQAVASGRVHDMRTTEGWIADCVCHGAGRNDAVLLARAWHASADADEIARLTELALALSPSTERLLETSAQGGAFSDVIRDAWRGDGAPLPYPIAVGRAAGAEGIAVGTTAEFYLHAFVSNLVSAAIRLVPLGQTDGQRVIAALLPTCRSIALEAVTASEDEIGGVGHLGEIASMQHEIADVRLFRS